MSLKAIRTRKGLTQQKLSDMSGVAREIITRIETEKTTPELPTLIKLADALECSIDEIVGRGVMSATASDRNIVMDAG